VQDHADLAETISYHCGFLRKFDRVESRVAPRRQLETPDANPEAESRRTSGDLVLPPIDDQCLAGHKSRIVARQERNRSADVARLREALIACCCQCSSELFWQIPSRPCVSEGGMMALAVMPSEATIVRQSRMNR